MSTRAASESSPQEDALSSDPQPLCLTLLSELTPYVPENSNDHHYCEGIINAFKGARRNALHSA